MKALRRLLLVPAAALCLASPAAADTANDLKNLLPEPPAGWKQGGVTTAKLRSGFRAASEYRASSGPATVIVVYRIGASSDTEREKKLLAAPEEAKKARAEVVELAGRKWLARSGKTARGTTQSLTTVLENDLVVYVSSVPGEGKSHEAFAAAIDFAALAKLK